MTPIHRTPWLIILALLTGCTSLPHPEGNIDILHYQLQLTPDLLTQHLQGELTVTFTSTASQIQLDAGELNIDNITNHNHQTLAFSKQGRRLVVSLPASTENPHTLTIRYQGQPKAGLYFSPAAQQIYTAFSTSDWMPCVDDPSDRATLNLTLILPSGLKAAANGQHHTTRPLSGDRIASEWRQTAPMPSYLYGFTAGLYREVRAHHAHVQLRYLGSANFDEQALRQVFADTPTMLRFFEDKAGIPYPGQHYTQVLAAGKVAQELNHIAMLDESYGKRVLANEKKIWLGAHELAHQWWGNGLTNRRWTEMWLNEGIASFMTAAYLEYRFGREEYLRHIDSARTSYEHVRERGEDKPLIFSDWLNPSANDRALVYDKGTYVVHMLREHLGDTIFWHGLRHYTQRYWGLSVTTNDFKAAMAQASGQDLTPFFAKWVYHAQSQQPKA
ncbi:M1 family metallopeptidase [Chitinivorax sp. B]|uniref:M1 family metallopeptidase n=1 Tax=Chitinivorax sp. B TaxID=2502235 RepID=UPI001484E978|nr:M1 family metallopeptidase [Chitinivorax sp. B]